jgi:DNA-binding GntR family transcriptional regulator
VKIRARPLHAQARQAVLERILRGELSPESRVVESRLATDLGVSRTPLREALMHLEREGFLRLEPNRGFFVAPLSTEEARELYPILAMIEAEALRLGGIPGSGRMAHLEDVDNQLAECHDDPEGAFHLNAEWHTVLTSGCPNRTLLKMLAGVRRKVYRYEWAHFARSGPRVEASPTLHQAILTALEDRGIDQAIRELHRHWLADLGTLLPAMGSATESG